MIRNLNAITFRDFGVVLSERPQNTKNIEKEAGTLLKLDGETAVVYRAGEQTQISGGTAMIVLSVSTDGETFWHFCLDKSVCLKAGVYYTMNPFEGTAEVRVYAAEPLEVAGQRSADELRLERMQTMDKKIRVEGIHTFFYQEKEQGFLFSGEAHSSL